MIAADDGLAGLDFLLHTGQPTRSGKPLRHHNFGAQKGRIW
jgi:hypothetical protein